MRHKAVRDGVWSGVWLAMEYVVVPGVALVAAGLTLFSGFGLGTILLPALAFYFPLEVAVALTAVVHLANNVFKFGLLGRAADWGVAARFGGPAIVAALAGAWLLGRLSGLEPWAEYELGRVHAVVTPVKVIIAALILGFALLEAWPRFQKWEVPARFLPVGGVLSGFFGGLSGHQGALRAPFLLRAGLTKEAFIATGVVIAVAIDVTRLGMYGTHLKAEAVRGEWKLVAAACAAAFVGSFVGAKVLGKVTIGAVRAVVTGLLVVTAGLLGAGWI